MLLKVINKIIGKVKHTGIIISYITIEGTQTYNWSKIANEFGKFYLKLDQNHARQKNDSINSIDHYIRKIPQNINSIVMGPTTQKVIAKLVKEIPYKTSHGQCKQLFARFLILSCPKCALVWGNCCERLCVEIFVRVLHSSEVISITPCK